jgi:hypothetical protein
VAWMGLIWWWLLDISKERMMWEWDSKCLWGINSKLTWICSRQRYEM